MLDGVWRKSVRSQDTNCVEVAYIDERVVLRDSQDRECVTLALTADAWQAFVAGIKDGEFDRA